MSVVNLIGVAVKNNPAPFNSPYEFEITIESLENLQHDLEWKLTYVGSATSSEHDQELDSLLVGPVPAGINKFAFEANPPNREQIPDSEIVGVTVILLTGSYQDREFVRVGYYVNNEYTDEALINEPPAKPVIEKIQRNILAEKPRVTRLNIKWDSEESAPAEFPPEQPDVDAEEADGDKYGMDEEDELEEEAEGEAETEDGPAKMDDDGDVEMGDGEGAEDDGAESEDIEAETEEEDYYDDEDDAEGDEAGTVAESGPGSQAKPAGQPGPAGGAAAADSKATPAQPSQ